MNLIDAIKALQLFKKAEKATQLYTVWGEHMDMEDILTEYPRPQLKRDNYTILNGLWNYCITLTEQMPEHYEGKILVPFSPESALSGVNRQLKPGEFLWYERDLIFDRIINGKRCILQFGAVDQYCEVFLNNKLITSHMGGYLPFSVDITDYIMDGNNSLILKVTDDTDHSYHSRGKQKLKRGGLFYTAQSGIWQTVWLEWVPDHYIKSIKLTPNLDDSCIKFEINMEYNPPMEMKQANEVNTQFKIEIFTDQTLVQSVNSSSPVVKVPLSDIISWSPEMPFLYGARITADEDVVESYFAMRKIEIRKDSQGIPRIYLNNRAYFQNGLLDQGYWPDGLYTAPSDEAMIYDIRKAKELGFNMLRKHIKIEPLRWYYHCDRLGMLVWQDIVNGGGSYHMFLMGYLPTIFQKFHLKDKHYGLFSRRNKEGRKEWLQECKDTVEYLYNSPSIAVWVPFNEGWGQFDSFKAAELVRSIDSTRLIDHASGWFDHQGGDLKSVHNYFHKLEVAIDKRAFVLSEFGGYACYIKDHSYSKQIFGYRIFSDTEELNEAYQKLYQNEIIPLIPKGLSAAVYTQLSDVEEEVNGLLTYDRKICKVSKINLNDGC